MVRVFNKGDALTHTKRVYVITAVKGSRYMLKDIKSGEELKTRYKPYELVKVGQVITNTSNDDDAKEEKAIHKATKKQNKLKKILEVQEGIDSSVVLDDSVKRREPPKEKEAEWEVDSITDQKKGSDSKWLYRIHWKGYDASEDTWQHYKDVQGTEAYDKWLKTKKLAWPNKNTA